MPSFRDHKEVLDLLTASQEAEEDRRTTAREAHAFVDHPQGQWEPDVWNQNENQPRYTFDKTSPIVDQICGQLEKADFDIKISPASGGATKDDAKIYDGLVRNIEYASDASTTYALAARNMVTAGLDGWMIVQKYVDADSFDQDLVIQKISNFIDSVWFGPFKEPDARDAKYCFVLEAIDKKEYEERFPEGSGQSVSTGRQSETYAYKREQITIGNIFYITEVPRKLALLKSGRVIDLSETEDILDELAASGDTVEAIRTRSKYVVKSRLFDGQGWLNKPQDTVFSMLPVVPCIANFKIFEDKLIYRGVVEKLLDPARVYNYARSRQISEGALAPRAKYWMTQKQVAGYESTLSTMNTNSDPVQFYNNDPEVPGPPKQDGGAMINPGLAQLTADMGEIMREVANMFAPSLGDNPSLQSGVAIQKLQDRGDIGTVKYFTAMERAIARTAKILVSAIPKVYSDARQVRILNNDGSFDMTEINQVVFDEQTGRSVKVRDLSRGQYDVVCSSGPSFSNRQAETVAAITEVGAVDPSAVQLGGDILFNNMDSPGMDLLAERKRLQLFNAGVIPEGQMTDEEKQKLMVLRSQPSTPDPGMVLAQAEAAKAQAQTNKVIVDANIAQSREARENVKVQLAQEDQMFKQFLSMQEEQRRAQEQIIDAQKEMASTLKLLRESMGIGTIITPETMQAYHKAAQNSESIM